VVTQHQITPRLRTAVSLIFSRAKRVVGDEYESRAVYCLLCILIVGGLL